MDVQDSEAEALLDAHFPDLTDKAKAREFVRLTPEGKELYLYAAVETISERQSTNGKRMDRIESCVRTTSEKVRKNSPKAHAAQAIYTTGAIIAIITAALTGRLPN